MEQAVQLRQLSDRLTRLEQEAAQLRTDINRLEQQFQEESGQQRQEDTFVKYMKPVQIKLPSNQQVASEAFGVRRL